MTAPALMTRADLRAWFAGLGLPPAQRPRLGRAALDRPITFTTPQGDHWAITPLITGAYLVAALSDECPACSRTGAGPWCKAHRCPTCDGCGQVTADLDGTCNECGGTGHNLLVNPPALNRCRCGRSIEWWADRCEACEAEK